MKVTNLTNVPKSRVEMEGAANALKQVPISTADGSPAFAFRVFTLAPHGHTPYHRHGFEHINYVIRGRGVLVSGSDEQTPIEEGDFALVLPDELHQYRNTSETEDLILICAVPKEFE